MVSAKSHNCLATPYLHHRLINQDKNRVKTDLKEARKQYRQALASAMTRTELASDSAARFQAKFLGSNLPTMQPVHTPLRCLRSLQIVVARVNRGPARDSKTPCIDDRY